MSDKASRLDVILSLKYPQFSRSYIQSLIADGSVKVNKEVVTKTGTKVTESSKISIKFPKKVKLKIIDMPVIYEDDDCIVINKPIGSLVHSKGAFNPESTVADWLKPITTGFEETGREGIVHRLDRGTSGLMICAKTPEALSFLQKQFSSRKVKKQYVAIVEGELDPVNAMIDLPIARNPKSPQRFKVDANGKKALTEYKVQKIIAKKDQIFSIVDLFPTTGRTHQLRVHLKYLKKPIVGDTFYEGLEADRLYLHAHKLEITLPSKQRKVFIAPIPNEFNNPKIK